MVPSCTPRKLSQSAATYEQTHHDVGLPSKKKRPDGGTPPKNHLYNDCENTTTNARQEVSPTNRTMDLGPSAVTQACVGGWPGDTGGRHGPRRHSLVGISTSSR